MSFTLVLAQRVGYLTGSHRKPFILSGGAVAGKVTCSKKGGWKADHDQSAQWCSKLSEPVWPSRVALLPGMPSMVSRRMWHHLRCWNHLISKSRRCHLLRLRVANGWTDGSLYLIDERKQVSNLPQVVEVCIFLMALDEGFGDRK